MINPTPNQATILIAENEEIIVEKQAKHTSEPDRIKRNLIRGQIANRQTIIASLQQFIK